MRSILKNWNRPRSLSTIGVVTIFTVLFILQACGERTSVAGTSASGIDRSGNGKVSPDIKITVVPPKGEGSDRQGHIAGTASGPDLDKCKVVIFAHASDKWYVEPYIAAPYTDIDSDGKWETDIFLGYEYAALLVKPGYQPPPTASVLPEVGGSVLAIARAHASQ
ncbi:MAG: hypothetical protein ACREDR_38800 [Blastocatellia bacterium]